VSIIFSVSSNSATALSTIAGSAHTPLRAPIGLNTRSPAAIASRYDGIFCGILKL
jgi:hypothetical protein